MRVSEGCPRTKYTLNLKKRQYWYCACNTTRMNKNISAIKYVQCIPGNHKVVSPIIWFSLFGINWVLSIFFLVRHKADRQFEACACRSIKIDDRDFFLARRNKPGPMNSKIFVGYVRCSELNCFRSYLAILWTKSWYFGNSV